MHQAIEVPTLVLLLAIGCCLPWTVALALCLFRSRWLMAIPRPKAVGAKVYHLIVYIDNQKASNGLLHEHARRCWFFQESCRNHDERMLARGYCPCGNTIEQDDGA